jgi:mRNA interferase RelE/StbE
VSNSPRYRVVVDKAAQKTLDRLPRNVRDRLGRAILALRDDPRPVGCVKMEGYDNYYRIRIAQWRIIYTIEDDVLVVVVVRVGSRGDVYKGF